MSKKKKKIIVLLLVIVTLGVVFFIVRYKMKNTSIYEDKYPFMKGWSREKKETYKTWRINDYAHWWKTENNKAKRELNFFLNTTGYKNALTDGKKYQEGTAEHSARLKHNKLLANVKKTETSGTSNGSYIFAIAVDKGIMIKPKEWAAHWLKERALNKLDENGY